MITFMRYLAIAFLGSIAVPVATAQYNPYAPGVGVAQNPYQSGLGGYNPYSPYGQSSGSPLGDAGGAYYGYSEVLKAYSKVITSQEYARILREQAMQAKIDTARKRFDYDLYVKANTPTFADEQAKIARSTLKRIQISSQPAEILSGKSQNVVLDDIRKFPFKKANMDPLPLSEHILSHVNATGRTNGLGMLRDGGKFQWPTVLLNLLNPETRAALERQTATLVTNALQGNVDAVLLDDLNTRMAEVRVNLTRMVNDLPSAQYFDADRFLTEFHEARLGIAQGQAVTQSRFQQFVKGGKTVQEVADYMVANGLKFAAATATDEPAYRALHSALIAFDLVLQADVQNVAATAGKDTTGTEK